MTEHARSQRLDLLVLARVAGAGGSSSVSPSKLHEGLARFVGLDRSAGERRQEIDERVADLVARGLLTTRPLTVTDEGRKWLCDGLGVDKPPPWATARNRLAPMLALGLRPGSAEAQHTFASSAQLQAAVIARAHGFDLTRPTLPQVLNLLCAQALATHQTVRSAADVRALLTESWVEQERWMPETRPAAPPPVAPAPGPRTTSPPAAEPMTSDEFADAVRAAAAQEQDGRFGDRKVFISALHRRLATADDRFRTLTLADFKTRLLEANVQRQLTLARADYVAAMDPDTVAASHIHDLGSDFHFVLDEEAR